MTKFHCKAGDLLDFIKTVSCKGVIEYGSGGKGTKKAVNKMFFSAFYIDAHKGTGEENDRLEVLTVDTWYKKFTGNFRLKNAKVLEEGSISIADPVTIMSILSGIKGSRVEVEGEGTTFKITSLDGIHDYDVRQPDEVDLESLNAEQESLDGRSALDYAKDWLSYLSKEDGFWKITIREQSVLYGTTIVVKKDDFAILGKDKNLTKDEETKIVCDEKGLSFRSGKANANYKGGHKVIAEKILGERITFEKEFYALHTIIPNLFKEISLHFRQISDGRVSLLIESSNANMDVLIEVVSKSED